METASLSMFFVLTIGGILGWITSLMVRDEDRAGRRMVRLNVAAGTLGALLPPNQEQPESSAVAASSQAARRRGRPVAGRSRALAGLGVLVFMPVLLTSSVLRPRGPHSASRIPRAGP